MHLKTHFIASSIVTLAFWPWFGWWSLLAFVGGFLVDVDHYLFYAVEKGDRRLLQAYLFYRHRTPEASKREVLKELFIFHTVEFLAVISALTLLLPLLLPGYASYLLHMAMDSVHEIHKKGAVKRKSILHFLVKK